MKEIKDVLAQHTSLPDPTLARELLKALQLPIEFADEVPLTPTDLPDLPRTPALDEVIHIYFLGLISQETLTRAIAHPYDKALELAAKYPGFLLFTLTLRPNPTRKTLADITRSISRASKKMPVFVLFFYKRSHNQFLTIATSERLQYRQSWRLGERPGKITLLYDINLANPHPGHLAILDMLRLPSTVQSFDQLHQKWTDVLSTSHLNRKFYQEIANWYFWAQNHAYFPNDEGKDPAIHVAQNLIRLITRLIFVWFLREKNLVPETLFDENALADLLWDFGQSDPSHNYYNAILQNLFFATLNQVPNQRAFAHEGDFPTQRSHHGIKNLYRYAHAFKIPPDKVLELFAPVPFLNGGLFECLDKEDPHGNLLYVDGFSRNPKKKARLPDFLFFGTERKVDLTAFYGPSHTDVSVRGILRILKAYKFTISENTPLEEEVALDPELLGHVFENLLASYNPETATTARKAQGSFYTPSPIVDFMVEQALHTFLHRQLREHFPHEADLLPELFQPDATNPFSPQATHFLLRTIDQLRILDPACGSGAFLMGALHKLVHLLQKLDPHNHHWKEIQYTKVIHQSETIFAQTDKEDRQQALNDLNENFDENLRFPDYGRRLYLIQHVLFGVDNDPIALEIAKLRFFIALLLDQKIDPHKPNFGIRPLPNLEIQFVPANTLIRLRQTHTLFRTPEIQQLEKQIQLLRSQYFTAKNRTRKIQLQNKEKELRHQLQKLLHAVGYADHISQALAEADFLNPQKPLSWFDPYLLFGISIGFDLILGNPPYIQLQKTFRGKTKFADLYLDQGFQTFERKGDIYVLFYERAIQLLKPAGILAFITSNKWMRAGYGKKLRAFFSHYNPLLLIDLGPGVFQSATVDTNILLLENTPAPHPFALRALTFDPKADLATQLQSRAVTLTHLSDEPWFIGSNAEQQLKEKIERIGKPLKDWDVKIYRGILTGLNEAFIITTEKRNEILAHCKTDEERQRTEAIIKPILRGRDIKRYYYEWAGLWV
ncbi:MAG: Eco57I restriction-modification methylase domain-containing protein, partial [Bacteroidia bacterium]